MVRLRRRTLDSVRCMNARTHARVRRRGAQTQKGAVLDGALTRRLPKAGRLHYLDALT